MTEILAINDTIQKMFNPYNKIEDVTDTVWLSLYMDDSGICKHQLKQNSTFKHDYFEIWIS